MHVQLVQCSYSLINGMLEIHFPGDFMSLESPQTLPASLMDLFEYEKQFLNLKVTIRRPADIHSSVLNFSRRKYHTSLAFKEAEK